MEGSKASRSAPSRRARRAPRADPPVAGRKPLDPGPQGIAENCVLQRIARPVGAVALGTTRMDRRSPAATATDVAVSLQLVAAGPAIVHVGLPTSTPLIRMLKV